MQTSTSLLSEPAFTFWKTKLGGNLPLRAQDIIIDKYHLLHVIDFGSSGEVWKASAIDQGSPVAIKVMRSPGFSSQAIRALEVTEILSKEDRNGNELFVNVINSGICSRHHYLVFPLLGISLATFMKRYSESAMLPHQKHVVLWQIARGIEFLHSLDIVHTDLKPDNIVLVDDTMLQVNEMDNSGKQFTKSVLQDSTIKIIDLEDSKKLTTKRTSYIGTSGYTAPEVYCGIGWGFSVDVFAFGCIMFELQFHKRFMPDISGIDVMFAYLERGICSFRPSLVKDIREHCPLLFDDSHRSPRVILRAADVNTVHLQVKDFRKTMRSFISDDSHQFKDLMRKCLHVDARHRLTASQCVQHIYFDQGNLE